MTKFNLRSLVYHETVPGHHFQVALELENTHLPQFRQMAAGTDNAYDLAIKHQVRVAFGTDTLFDPKLATRQGAQLAKLTVAPARILGLDRGTLNPGAVADVTVIDPDAEWTIDPKQFRSKSRNTPFAGRKVRGRAHLVLVGGEVKFTQS